MRKYSTRVALAGSRCSGSSADSEKDKQDKANKKAGEKAQQDANDASRKTKQDDKKKEPIDFVLLIVLGDAIQQGLTQDDYSVTGAFIVIFTIAAIQVAVGYLTFRSPRVRSVVQAASRTSTESRPKRIIAAASPATIPHSGSPTPRARASSRSRRS